jgi:hemerythrin-like domain-containing protein
MDAIETLMREHRTIEKVIDALTAFTQETRRRGATARGELARFVAFLRRYADDIHHGKEEEILFRTMADHGFPTDGGPLAVMLGEHARGRALVAVLASATEGTAPWSDEDRRRIAEAAAAYGALLRSHIHKEDAILYPMAEQHLPPQAMAEVDLACAERDADPATAELSDRYAVLAEELVATHSRSVHPSEVHP